MVTHRWRSSTSSFPTISMILRRVRSAADFLKGTLHEVGHTMGLGHAPSPQTAGKSVMNGRSGINDVNNLTPTDVQECDKQSVNQNPQCPTPTPSPSPSPSPTAMPQTVLIRTNRSDTLPTVRRGSGRGSQRRNFIGTLKRIAFSGLIVRR